MLGDPTWPTFGKEAQKRTLRRTILVVEKKTADFDGDEILGGDFLLDGLETSVGMSLMDLTKKHHSKNNTLERVWGDIK